MRIDRPVHAVQVSGFLDPQRRDPEELLVAWPTLLDTAAAAGTAGARVTVLQAATRDAVIERQGVRFRFVGAGPAAALLPWKLARLAHALQPDVVHLHGLGFPLHARVLARAGARVRARVRQRRGRRAPLLVQDHADRVPSPWRRPLHRWGLAGVAAVGFTAREQAEPFVRAGILPTGVRIVELLESSSRFTPGDRDRARAVTGLDGDPCVLWVGRLDRNKDPLTALEAVARAAEDLPDLRLWCCYTEAPLLDAVRDRVSVDPRLSERVRLLGRVPHARVEELCRAADLFLTASRFEGSGYAVIEALACGLPAVATDIPSFRRITGTAMGHGRPGRLAPPGDAAALAHALVATASEVTRDREGIPREVRLHFERTLSFEALGRELVEAYEALSFEGAAEGARA